MNDDSHDHRIYLAAERTFLGWIRTGLALMALGLLFARVGVVVLITVVGGAILLGLAW